MSNDVRASSTLEALGVQQCRITNMSTIDKYSVTNFSVNCLETMRIVPCVKTTCFVICEILATLASSF